jgi:hypothetical protein
MLGRFNAPLYRMLTQGLGVPRKITPEVEFKTLTDHPKIRDIDIKGQTAAGADTALVVATVYLEVRDSASHTITNPNKLLKIGDRIHIHSYQTYQTSAAGTVSVSGEVMEVTAMGTVDGAVVTVTRNVGSASTAENVTADSAAWLHATIIGPAVEEGADVGEVLTHALISQTNTMQMWEEAFQVTMMAQGITLAGYGPGGILTHEEQLALDAVLRKIEDSILLGKGGRSFVNSKASYSTWGVIPQIVGDSATAYGIYTAASDLVTGTGAQRIWQVGAKANINLENLLTFFERVYDEGGENKVFLMGSGLCTEVIKAFQGYWQMNMREDGRIYLKYPEMQTQYAGAPLPFMIHPAFKGPRRYDGVVLDLDYLRLHEFPNEALHIWKGHGGNGVQGNGERVKKYAWQAQQGVEVSYKLAHAVVLGVKNDDNTYGGPVETVGTLTPSDT